MKPITDRLDRFDLIAELASGGNATVFLARLADAAFPRLVAIKRLHAHLARDGVIERTFLREAGLAARLDHPNVVSILEVGTSAEGYYLVMEYIEGDTLAHVLARSVRRGHPIPLRVTMRVVLDALAGLSAIHDLIDDDDRPLGLVHGSVSPRNVMIGVDGIARVADFGVAHAASRAIAPRRPPKDELAYMAPEQARGERVDQRADLFAIGVLLWECVAHRRLFHADSDGETIEKVAHAPAPRLDQVHPEVPAALARACARALERDPAWRPADAAELRDAIDRAAREHDLIGTAREVAAHLDLVIGADIVRQRDEIRALIARGDAVPGFASGSHLVLPARADDPLPLPAPALTPMPMPMPVRAPRAPSPPPPPPRPVSELETTVTSKRAVAAALRARTATTALSELDAAELRATAPAPVEPSAAPGEFGKYVVLGHLADGGMAEVYLARASGIEGFEKIVVVKRLKPELARSETATQLFLQEARIAATLEHPQIAQVYDVGVVDGSYFFAMEHVYGEDLRKVMNAAIRTQRPILLEDALRVITELAGALHYAHEKRGPDGAPLGLVHRDVSPSNVLVSHDGAVKLCDFGVAEVTAGRAEGKQRVLAGKLSYMSPEQCRGDGLDRRSDVFVLAVVLYELTTLTKLFKGKADRDVVQQIVSGRIKPPSALRADYPRELERIVMKGLALDPRERYQTAQDLRADLEAFGREEKLALSAVGLSRLMHALFEPDVAAWQAAVKTGHVPALIAKAGEPPSATATDFDREAVVELRAPRRWHRGWLALAALAGAAAAASVPYRSARDDARTRAADELTASAGRIGARLAGHLRAVRARADGIAQTPMLRAAIDTDAATMQDMIAKEALFTPGDGEVIECFRWRGERAASLVRVPAGVAALPALRGGEVRLEAIGDGVRATASARLVPLYEQGGGAAGAVVIAQPIDAASLARELPHGVARASLRGLGAEVALRDSSEPDLDELAIPIAIDADAGRGVPPIVLAAALPARGMTWLPPARAGAIGVACACALFYLIGRRRHRWWRQRSSGGAL